MRAKPHLHRIANFIHKIPILALAMDFSRFLPRLWRHALYTNKYLSPAHTLCHPRALHTPQKKRSQLQIEAKLNGETTARTTVPQYFFRTKTPKRTMPRMNEWDCKIKIQKWILLFLFLFFFFSFGNRFLGFTFNLTLNLSNQDAVANWTCERLMLLLATQRRGAAARTRITNTIKCAMRAGRVFGEIRLDLWRRCSLPDVDVCVSVVRRQSHWVVFERATQRTNVVVVVVAWQTASDAFACIGIHAFGKWFECTHERRAQPVSFCTLFTISMACEWAVL